LKNQTKKLFTTNFRTQWICNKECKRIKKECKRIKKECKKNNKECKRIAASICVKNVSKWNKVVCFDLRIHHIKAQKMYTSHVEIHILCGRLHVESTSEVVLMYVDSTSKVDFVCGIHIQSGKWDVEKTWIPHTYVENMSSQQKKLAS